ncbi:acyl-CoA dehydrogenase [Streptomyces sp. NPDC048717]|uniref:acyl-CoA dehydrogenase family protein n=1 Tax=Streptomyces sp. NPDC048717 TaxID=3154928 RepID=UPI003416BF8F
MISREIFRHRPELTPAERISLAYDRLRVVNEVTDDAVELARDPQRLAGLHEWAGISDGRLGSLISIHYNLFLGSLLDHDSGADRDLSDFASMRRIGTFLCTEIAHGNDVAALETTAELDPVTGGFVLHTPHPGAQKFMPNTSMVGGAKSGVVAARLLVDGQDEGVFLFLVPLSDEKGPLPGVRVLRMPDRMGGPVDHSITGFDHVRLPPDALLQADHGRLDRDGRLTSNLGSRRKRFLRSIGRVTQGKLCMSACGVGVSRAALDIAVRYAHHRDISGPRAAERVPLAAHRSHHGNLLRSLATNYAMTFLHRSVVAEWKHHTPDTTARAERTAAIAKAWITWQAREITLECRERCGAQGLFPLNGLAEYPMELEGTITAEGDNLVIWLKAAAEMILGHQVDRGKPSGRVTAQESLTDLAYLRSLLADLEAIWQQRARTALRQGPSKNSLGRWNRASPAALEMVSAHARLLAADAFIAAAGKAATPQGRNLLELLCRLFLVQELNRHTGDLLAAGRMHGDHVLALPDTLEETVAALAPHMLTFVDAFDLPSQHLSAIPIANSDYAQRFDALIRSTAEESPEA